MLKPQYQKQFERDLKTLQKRCKDMSKYKHLAYLLINEIPLPPQYRDHPLKGGYIGHRECHIEPDWLVIYKIDKPYIEFIRTGTHSDLF